ncbi:hypothetical protein M569_10049, partial [Genlisea aurea]
HDGIFFVLQYLTFLELLRMAEVCKSLRDAVRDDIVPGNKLVVYGNWKPQFSDDWLAGLAAKLGGRVQTLVLVQCFGITDDGLLRFVLSNPKITELHVRCCRVTPEGLITVARHLRLKILRMEGTLFVNKDHLETLHQLVQSPYHQRIFSHRFGVYQLNQLGRAIDVEVCPKCNLVEVVYDCPRVSCEDKCRACLCCTSRCLGCGACLRAGRQLLDGFYMACESCI